MFFLITVQGVRVPPSDPRMMPGQAGQRGPPLTMASTKVLLGIGVL